MYLPWPRARLNRVLQGGLLLCTVEGNLPERLLIPIPHQYSGNMSQANGN